MRTAHYEKLRAYVLEVAREMLLRGLIRHKTGATPEQVVATEFPAVLKAVWGDLKEVAEEFGGTTVDKALDLGQRLLADFLSPPRRK